MHHGTLLYIHDECGRLIVRYRDYMKYKQKQPIAYRWTHVDMANEIERSLVVMMGDVALHQKTFDFAGTWYQMVCYAMIQPVVDGYPAS